MSLPTRGFALALGLSTAFAVAQTPSYVFVGKAPNAQFGSTVTNAGDVDGDGYPELLIGSPIDPRTTEKAGALELRSGRTRAVLFTWLGPGKGDELGFGADGAGDVDGDGRPDLVCGVLGGVGPERSFIGHARVYSGKTGARLHTFIGHDHYDFYGLAVAGLGDLDGDGRAEIAAGCPGDDSHGRNRGFLEVRLGSTGAVLHVLRGDADDDQFGWFCRAIGDVDGDGANDLLIGAPGHKVDGKPGYVRLHSGRSGALLHRIEGEAAGDRLGWCVAKLGDLDGDGVPDLLCGAPFHDAGSNDCGAVYVFSGKTGARLQKLIGAQAEARFGWAVHGADDLDGDGKPDFVVGSPLEDGPTNGPEAADADRGAARGFSGASGEPLFTLRGRHPKAEFGFSVCELGEVEPGQHELVVGARSDLGEAGMVGTAAAYRIATGKGDRAPVVIEGSGELERFDPSELHQVDPARTIELPTAKNHTLVIGVGLAVLLLLGAAFAASRR
ncbi:MAG: FG-GAP repeat protein [Planctomycetes bacterium]|nr:FG-GAP repeat protein [Planctomycetota bacterium]